MTLDLQKKEFHKALVKADREARDLPGYTGHVFRKMIAGHGGWKAAKLMLQPMSRGKVQDGFVELWMCGGIELTVESIILEPKWYELFTRDDRREAYRRLSSVGCEIERELTPHKVRYIVLQYSRPLRPLPSPIA
ncbi:MULTISPECIES: hypothetical protein [unclassified Mesorhizobium]|uniref:hypothetical protein n=1 Tax=unclassified Mesorhizobium TaxID=325217 RepID=UPI000FCC8ED3|nr:MULTISPECIES: hypothetical protein [unclassified Mesorhizobium]RUU62659.1 hypothetical protein EOC99_17350 [Mesorhizobium sp. M7A.T.Ca.TU.009.01.1.1]RUU88455.1 hypothetical protein EOD03_04810 [Mesorhizobium sp. M7A.T.Ca.TU.009.01.1.2]RUT84827.1 hypothetical protein EOD14_19535 [Mesorhizobium sp. M7A.T.Ca.US.000.02.1.1]RUT94653.1 hypothetical protein EOD15_00970 [Mesorhizobium sp. M7A.T.Ca.US.000.02.2.1]RUU03657.1 hypothetical protein EOD12_09560 [Mesorhizobium sp. M7A.T.Ca.TU.009.02.1.1]